jgi:hypothetical protein
MKVAINYLRSAILLQGLFAQGQGTFQNLDFEQANPQFVAVPGSFVTPGSALPDWTATVGGTVPTAIPYNSATLGAPAVTLLGPPPPTPAFSPIDGNYSVLLQGSFPSAEPAISQTGLIPPGTQALLFKANPGNGALDVSIDNQSISFVAMGSGPGYTLYGANISVWAGQTEALTFTAAQDTFSINNWELDDISFSPNAVVPEPSPLLLTSLGGALVALYRRLVFKRE